ncbi:ATP-binding protein [Cryomorphaceae bacterium 1068]|nr:ATP-binding protein [Cryomorphaceae bacterium 1068]
MAKWQASRSLLLCLYFLSCIFCVYGQNLKFESVPTELGLSQNFISDIAEDSTGFIWVATPSGLNRFDGYGYRVFKNDPKDSLSLGDDSTHKLIIDKRGALWVGHAKGLQVYDIQSNHFIPVPLGYEASVRNLVHGNGNEVWVVDGKRTIHRITYGEGSAFDVKSYRDLLPNNNKKDDIVRSIAVDAQDRLWVNAGIFMALVSFESGSPLVQFVEWDLFKQKETLSLADALRPELFSGDRLAQGMFMDDGGRVFIYDEWFLTIVAGDKVTSMDIRTLKNGDQFDNAKTRYKGFVDKSNVLWMHTSAAGAHMAIDLNKCTVLDGNKSIFDIITAGVMRVTQAENGVMWLGTNGNGLYKAIPHEQIFNSPPVSQRIPTRTVYPIYKDEEGNVWFSDLTDIELIPNGMNASQQLSFSLAGYNFKRNDPKNFNFSAKFIKGDGEGGMWLGNYDGLHRIRKDGLNLVKHEFYKIDQKSRNGDNDFLLGVYDLIADSSGQIWIVTAGEFGKFHPETGIFEGKPFEVDFKTYDDNRVTNRVIQTDTNTFWIGTINGLIRYDDATGSFEYFYHDPDDSNSLSSSSIKCLTPDPSEGSVIWVGTFGDGLDRFDTKTGEFFHYTTEDGLPDETVYGILTNGDNELWISTNKGLCSFDLDDETFQTFTTSDGLQDNEFNTRSFYQAPDGELLFGGIYGINRFYPDRLFESEYHPATAITAVKINNEPVRFDPDSDFLTEPIESAQEITLGPDVKMVSFSVSGMDMSFPERTNYQYQLANFDESWNTIGNERTITFTSLPYGDYTLKIRSTNRSGKWSDKVRELRLFVLAPWWQTWWAYSLYVILLIAIVVFIYLFQLKSANERREAQRLLELDTFKSRLFTNITHEFRTPITVISGMASMIEDQPEYTQTIRKNADNLLQMVNQILDLSKLEANKLEIRYKYGNLVEYIRYLTESLSGTAIQQEKKLVFHSDPEEINMDYDEAKIRHIIYNLLSNALKFTNAGDRIDISLRQTDDQKLYVTIRDTGIGIAKGKLPHIFNRFYQADDSSTRAAEGTGIGLSLCYELVKLLDGQMGVESEEGVGSTFSFSLPIHTEHAQGDYEPFLQTIPEPADREIPNNSKEKETAEKPLLLLIEDNYEIVRFIELLLDDSYSIVHAENGAIGIEVAVSNIPDIIISDVMMPMKNGYEVTETLKNDIRTSHIPIILLTAKSTQEDRNIGLEKGADAYLHKPFDKGELQIRLRKLIELRNLLISKFKGLEESDEKGDELENRFLFEVKQAVLENLDNSEFKVEDLEKAMKLSKMQLYRKLKALTGMSPTLVVRDLRLTEASKLIRKGELIISELAYTVGFSDPSYFTRAFKEKFDVAPSQYK